jgi:hypothetical protein
MRRNDPAWRAMFSRLRVTEKAAGLAEAQRWKRLTPKEKYAEMSAMARRWRGLSSRSVERTLAGLDL